MTVKLPVNIVVTSQPEPVDLNQARQLLIFLKKGIPIASKGPETIFVDKEGHPITDEMRWWLPKKLNFWNKEDGGPYEEIILLNDHYVDSGIPDLDNPLVKVKSLNVKYRIESKDIREIKIDGEEIVKAVLIDNASRTHEYVKHQLQGGRLTIQSSRRRQVIGSRVLQYRWLKFGNQANRVHKEVYDASGDLRGERSFPSGSGDESKRSKPMKSLKNFLTLSVAAFLRFSLLAT